MQALTVSGLKKTIHKKAILNDVSFTIEQGESVGLVGINGAGKSSIFKCIAGLWHCRGDMLFYGKPIKENYAEFASKTGILIEYPSLFSGMTLRENIQYFSSLRGTEYNERYEQTAKLLNIDDAFDKKIETFSSGMKQKACLLIATLHEPSILLLDEPTSMLDPKSAAEIRAFISQIKQRNKLTLLISSHNLAEIENLCDKVRSLVSGRIRNDYILHGNDTKKEYRFRFATAELAGAVFAKTSQYFNVSFEEDSVYLYGDVKAMKDFILSIDTDFIDLTVNGGLEKIFMETAEEK